MPTPILKLRGGFRADRHAGRPGADVFDHVRPACPQWLITRAKNDDAEFVRRAAKSAWDRLVPQLFAAGLLVDAFRETFIMLMDSWGRYCLCCKKCNEEGMTTTGAKENDVKSPWTRLRAEFLEEVTKLAACFGLTPADIASVRALDVRTSDDAKAKFFKPQTGA